MMVEQVLLGTLKVIALSVIAFCATLMLILLLEVVLEGGGDGD
jgi:hypothetical protein